ncbi:FAD-binding protein [Arthrobacter sp. NtRootA1]|uniref:FAD-binding protein n=1 Tax=Micrococcaceae TaxID=1268 RepID=UPI001CC5AEF7|nr:FAD-binding protein [Arthrobacter sp. NtRootA1]BCW05886.1 3-oxosteroid 1-dehydrogenase [Arthrobacter sp. NtRootA1]
MFDANFDFVVIGSGAGAFAAAIAARKQGMKTLILEKTDKVGGTSAISGGAVWIPNNHLLHRAGQGDSRQDALTYMNAAVGPETPATSMDLRLAFLDSGPEMVQFLEAEGMRWRVMIPYPEYYSSLPKGDVKGRSLEVDSFDMRTLGPWEQRVRGAQGMPGLVLYNTEARDFLMIRRTIRGFYTAGKVGLRSFIQKIIGRHTAAVGQSLIGQLLKITLDRGVQVWPSSPVGELIVEGGSVVGVVADHNGKKMRIGASRGVLIASGGFSRNTGMRQEFQQGPVDLNWSLVPEGADGDFYQWVTELGAETAQMDLAWWMPTMIDDKGVTRFNIWERSHPHAIVVDSTAQRFVSESTGYLEFGAAMEERNKTVPALPSWQIIDSQHRRSYPFAYMPPGVTPQSAIDGGFLIRADTIEELANKIGLDPRALRTTVDRFNGFAKTGIDEDFNRGYSAFERHYSDPRQKPNPTLGTIESAPFYAIKIGLGDLGTKGGAITDCDGRVLREDGTTIPGLYAVGNATASMLGDSYPAAGATIGAAMVFGYRAALAAANSAP